MKLLLFTVLCLGVVLVLSQGDSCTTHENLKGICTELPNCNTLITLYRQDRSQQTINILMTNQKSCGNRKFGRNPLMCCGDGVSQNVAPVSQQPLQLLQLQPNVGGRSCYTPDRISGYCVNVEQCPSIHSTYIENFFDPEYVQYIISSKANCNDQQQICCPSDSRSGPEIAPPESSTYFGGSSQLFTPRQYPVNKVPQNRVVENAAAKQGDSCTTHEDLEGTCVELPNCNSLITRYRQDRSHHTANILITNQKSCGNRKVGRNPLMCCSDGVSQNIAQSPPQRNAGGPSCFTPDNITGYCIKVEQCPSILNTYIQKFFDPEYVQYIIKSNANCSGYTQLICCPNDSSSQSEPQIAPPELNVNVSDLARSELFTPGQCGVSKVPHNRVVGGAPAKKGGWPWMALLGYRNRLDEIDWKCGGTIISNRHILTAAHCILKNLAVVRLGEHDLNIDTEVQHVDLSIRNRITHPSYDKKDGNSDVAIVVLDQPIQFTQSISPICLPLENAEKIKNFIGYTPFAAGWGRTQESGKTSKILQETQLPVIDNDKCRASYNAINKVASDKQFNDAVICAGYDEGGRDTCNGDSGGPLMFPLIKNGEVSFYQIGIVSYGIGCARAQVPGVYARVATFTDWIKNIVETT